MVVEVMVVEVMVVVELMVVVEVMVVVELMVVAVEVAGPLGTPLGLAQRKRASPRGEGSRTSPQDERLLLNHTKTPGFLAPGREEFNPEIGRASCRERV